MSKTRWTLGVVLAAAVSLWGLVEADASPFSSYILSDDLANTVRGSAAEPSEWDEGSESVDNGETDSGGDASDTGNDNNGHGNNEDGVDSSNPGQGKGGPNGEVDASCDGTGECVDDEIKGSSEPSSEPTTTVETTTTETTTTETKTSNGKAKGKNK